MFEKVGIIGAGQMGSGIAHVCAVNGIDVVMSDISLDRAEAGLEIIKGNIERQIAKGRVSPEEMEAALSRITVADTLKAHSSRDVVIEAATEDEHIKTSIFKELCPHLKKGAFLASNTSSISITRLATSTDRPELFMGMHFMNPVPIMKLVELIPGIATSRETHDKFTRFAAMLGKTATVSEDFPAFIVNRILIPMINEGIYTLYEGVGSVEAIDEAMRLGANHPMGPLTLADFIGLDTCLSIMQVLYDGLADSKYRPCPLLVKYVEAGWLGRKTGRGFYDYRGDGEPVPTR